MKILLFFYYVLLVIACLLMIILYMASAPLSVIIGLGLVILVSFFFVSAAKHKKKNPELYERNKERLDKIKKQKDLYNVSDDSMIITIKYTTSENEENLEDKDEMFTDEYYDKLHKKLSDMYNLKKKNYSSLNGNLRFNKRLWDIAILTIYKKNKFDSDMLSDSNFYNLSKETVRILEDAMLRSALNEREDISEEHLALLSQNIYYFSSWKVVACMYDVNRILLKQANKRITLKDFQQEANKLFEVYFGTYLTAEYYYTIDSAKVVAKWAHSNLPESKNIFSYDHPYFPPCWSNSRNNCSNKPV